MSETGQVVMADLGAERPRRVLVLSNRRFTTMTGRALVAPEWLGPPDVQLLPWQVRVGNAVFAIDRLVSVKTDRLLDDVGEASYTAVMAARRALLAIT
ncbi:MAG TPA: type II toxin-antitoxin system PemK/MazF family toxin [Iamia sp.]|nr:type II toxin-antitoxin system PemK/MazF family toxin [Iamia sp.]